MLLPASYRADPVHHCVTQACMSKNKSVYDEILAEMASIEEGVDKKAAEGASEASEAQAAAGAQTR